MVDTEAFNAAMERQKAEARKAWKGSGEAATETIWFQLKEKLGATEFLGYETEAAAGEVTALVKGGKEAKTLKAGDEAAIIVNQTPYYGEFGGQVGDEGLIRGAKDALFRVTDTQKKAGGLVVHLGRSRRAPSSWARRSTSRSITRAAWRRAPTTPRRTCYTRRCARSWDPTWRRRARLSRRIVCASTSRIKSP